MQFPDENAEPILIHELLLSFMENAPELPRDFQLPKGVTAEEAEAMRLMHSEGAFSEILALDFNLTEEVVDSILEGKVAPFAGGPVKLSKPKKGLGKMRQHKYLNDRKFTAGCIAIGRAICSSEQFEVLMSINGATQNYQTKLKGLEDNEDPRKKLHLYRSFFRQHAKEKKLCRPRERSLPKDYF